FTCATTSRSIDASRGETARGRAASEDAAQPASTSRAARASGLIADHDIPWTVAFPSTLKRFDDGEGARVEADVNALQQHRVHALPAADAAGLPRGDSASLLACAQDLPRRGELRLLHVVEPILRAPS